MEKFIPYEKRSKKEKRKMNLAKRQTWGELNPVTWQSENITGFLRFMNTGIAGRRTAL